MREDLIAPPSHVRRLGEQLVAHYGGGPFERAETMGELVEASLDRLLHRTEPATAPPHH